MESQEQQPPDSESRLELLIERFDGEVWSWLLLLGIGAAGILLASVLPPKVLGASTAILLYFSLTSIVRVRLLRKRLAALARKKAAPESSKSSHTPNPPPSPHISEAAVSILCMLHKMNPPRLTAGDFRERLHLPAADVEHALDELVRREFVKPPPNPENHPGASQVLLQSYWLLPAGTAYLKATGLR